MSTFRCSGKETTMVSFSFMNYGTIRRINAIFRHKYIKRTIKARFPMKTMIFSEIENLIIT